jgi:uncharacterized membrane protein YfhO
VNGEERELLQANTAFMGLPLTPGTYEIELEYCTPGLKMGAIISAIGLTFFIGVCVFEYLRRKELSKK